jgi:hypothetical protein
LSGTSSTLFATLTSAGINYHEGPDKYKNTEVRNGHFSAAVERAVVKYKNLDKSVPSEALIKTKLHENCSLGVSIRIWNKDDPYSIRPYPSYPYLFGYSFNL